MDEQQQKAMFVLRVVMALIALALGLGLDRADFRRVLEAKRAVLVGMVAQTLLVPLLGFGVAAAFRLEPVLAVGLVLLTACPGGVHANYYNRLARGDVALSMTLTSVSTLVNMGTLPLWVLAATQVFSGERRVVTMDPGAALFELACLLLLPLGLGMALRASRPGVAVRLEKGMMVLAGLVLVLVVLGSVAKNAGLVAEHAARVGLPVLVLQALAMGGSYALARAAGLPVAQRITVALEGGIQNATLAYALAMMLTRDVSAAVPSIVYSLAIYATAAVFIPFGRRAVPAA